MATKRETLRNQILDLVSEYYQEAFPPAVFIPGETPVQVSGRVFDASDLQSLVDAGLDFWLTTGRFAGQLEDGLAKFLGIRHASLVNSGSSANLLALASLTSPSLGERRLRPGDEVITLAAGFPTTVNPILQNELVPVFVDVGIPTYNVDVSMLEAALSTRTRAVIFAHTLGNPFDLEPVTDFVKKHKLLMIEDCCDALGASYKGQPVGTFGDLATLSFYPAHHITTGEGGAVLTNQPALKKLVESFRDWGRDCWCEPGKDNTCGKRFDWQLGELPYGYDHKYTYSHIGYNLKATDMQASVGISQLRKLPEFIQVRKKNFNFLYQSFKDLEEFFILPEPTPGSEPSWFGFPLGVREDAPFTREQLLRYLQEKRIGTRLLFGGNLARQPAYQQKNFRCWGKLANTDYVMKNVFWMGVYPGLNVEMLSYIAETLHEFIKGMNG